MRRFLRIFPIYYLVLFTAAAYGIPSLHGTLIWHVFYFSNFCYYAHSGWGTVIGHFWTLSVEEQFYLFWPFLVLLIPAKRLTVVFICVLLAGPAYRVAGVLYSSIGHFYIGTPGSFDSLAIGALLALGLRQPHSCFGSFIRHRWFLGTAALCLWVICAHLGGLPRSLKALDLSFLSIFFAAVICQAASGFTGVTGQILNCRPLRYVGQISYGLYLFHNFASLATRPLLTDFPVLQRIPGNWILCNLVITLAAGAASWHFFERPINQLKSRFSYRHTQEPAAKHPEGT